jgi:hypothetical protein
MKSEADHGKEIDPNHIEVIKHNLPVLTEYCEMEPYQGDFSYPTLKDYMTKAEKILSKRSNEATLKADGVMAEMIRNIGKEAVLDLKRSNYNIKLEEFVIGADQGKMLEVVEQSIVPRAGLIFLKPQSTIGRAPFYSSEKIVGSHHIKTLWFNMGIMLLMSIIVAILLFTDCPGRYIRKGEQ